MSDNLTIRTNHVPRLIVDAYELTIGERAEFDYLDWDAIEDGRETAEFLRYRGQLYDLGEFDTTARLPRFSPLAQWDGYINDSFFSGVVVKFYDNDHIIAGTFYS